MTTTQVTASNPVFTASDVLHASVLALFVPGEGSARRVRGGALVLPRGGARRATKDPAWQRRIEIALPLAGSLVTFVVLIGVALLSG